MAYTFKHGDRPLEGLTVQRAVGRGGFGEVYYALTDSGKQIALKYLRDNPEVELRGISHTMNLKSPHLITIYDVRSNADHEPFVVMEYVSGPSLLELMTAEPKGLGPQKAAFFLSGIAKGLSYLHERGIVHRDLKPGNIFYDDGYVKIGDYGLSKHMSISRHSGNTVSVGTVHYMAPEIGSGNYTKAIDIYALGVILYEMLTGRLPFTGSSMAEILMRHLQDRPDLGGISEPFASVISRALQKNPADRYQDVNEMVDAVLSAAEVSDSFRSFDPTSMSQVARDPNAADAFRTMTTPPRPVAPAPLDVRGVMADVSAGRIPPIPPIPPMPGETHGARRSEPQHAVAAPGGPLTPAKSNWPTLLTMALTVVAASTIITLVSRSRQEETPIAIGLFLIGGTIGVLLAHFQIILRNPLRNPFADRLMYAAGGFACALPGLAVASDTEDYIARLIIPLVAVMGVCDMGKRIDAGRNGIVRGGWLWSPAILGLICAAAVNDGRAPWAGAGLCAGLALLVQLAAGMWPVRSRVQPGFPAWHDGSVAVPATPAVHPAAARRTEENPKVVMVDLRPPGATGDQAFAGAISGDNLRGATPRPTSPIVRLVAGVFSIVLIAVSLGCFFANLSIRVEDPRAVSHTGEPEFAVGSREWNRARYAAESARSVKGGLMFGTLAPLAALVIVGRKALQREAQPIWRGTLRWLFASIGLMLAAGMIAILSSQVLSNEERAATIFGLVVGVVGAIGCLAFAGPKVATAPLPTAPPVPPGTPDIATSVRDFVDQAMRTASESIQAATDGLKGTREPLVSAGGGAVALRPDVPSFAGRAGNAGMSFIGKLLLLGALTAAVISRAGPIEILEHNGDGIVIGAGHIDFRDNGKTVMQAHLEPPVFIIPAIAGTLLLAFSRRRDGASHMTRAFIAGGLILAAAVLASGPGADEVTRMFQRRMSSGQIRISAAPLVICGGMFLAGLTLLFWPRRRDQNTIVI